MFKPTQSLQKTLTRKLPLSTKQAGREYYKGNRVGSMGTIDRYGRFHPDYSKIRTFVYPAKGIKAFELTPFVSYKSPVNQQETDTIWAESKPISGAQYLSRWKSEGGHDPAHDILPTADGSQKKPQAWEESGKKN